jgi:6-pyruvoyltetrahydropterin/6-carboxytetrahydropterin synthase
VIDFGVLKRVARERCEALDHTFLLQRASRVLDIVETAKNWKIAFGEHQRYVFPKSDVTALPIENTTAELLARWFHDEIGAALRAAGHTNIGHLRVEVEEAPGQSGWYAGPLA